ncbi:AAA family ATPase [Comamonas terrae]|uniref:AAA family ATPase n=1 Tax=Comamonas terrae TaxID=673548 RepID=A0ABW5UM89_9BURK|nr:AAA family ATPase [Comamonas terrae]
MKIRISKLIFNGFRSADQTAVVDFSASPVSVIYGLNGSGKTTFLRAINAFLSQNNQILESICVNSIYCEYFEIAPCGEIIKQEFPRLEGLSNKDISHLIDSGTFEAAKIQIPESLINQYGIVDESRISTAAWKELKKYIEEPVLRKLVVDKKDSGYDWSRFESSSLFATNSLSLGIERGVTTQQTRVEPDLILEFFSNPRYRSLFSMDREKSLHMLAQDLSFYIRQRQNALSRVRKSEFDLKSKHANLQNIKLENIQGILIDHYEAAKKSATLKIQNALFDTLAFAIDQESNITVDAEPSEFYGNLEKGRPRLIEALKSAVDNKFKETILKKLEGLESENDYKEVYNNELLRKLFNNMMAELKVERLLLSSINLIVEKFNKYLIDGKRLEISEEKVVVKIDDKELEINELSSGERHILTFLTLVLFHGQDRDFLIIDEPEISLNITWQRELLGLFNELVPDTQIIVASHSPAISKRNPHYLTELVTFRV